MEEVDLKPLYLRAVFTSLGNGMVQPFMGAYVVQLGASPSQMGWYQSSTNIANNVMQVFWGRLSDRVKRRIPFIVLGGIILASLWIPMILITNPSQLIILLVIQALFGSMATPAWTALIGDIVPHLKLGKANASINLWTSIGGAVATLISGVFMTMIVGSIQQTFFIPLTLATVSGITASLIMFRLKEKKKLGKKGLEKNLFSDIVNIIKTAKKSRNFLKYCYAAGTFNFFMSISWPLFSMTQIRVLNASMLQLALISVIQTITTIIFQNWAGKLADTIGRKPLLVFFRFALVTVPITYALSTNVNTVILISPFWGFAIALGQASVNTYLLDTSPEEYRGSFVALFNLILGIVTFFGSLIGGYLSNYTINVFGLVKGLQMAYLLSICGRALGAGVHLTLEETLKKTGPRRKKL
jgi:MFS family permease